jgi:hypothetical protein
MPKWSWTIYESNEVDAKLYQYLKSLSRMKDKVTQALEAFYLPYALEYINASPLEIQKAYQRSIDILRSRARIMSLDAGKGSDVNVHTSSEGQLQPSIDRQQSNLANTKRFDDKDELDEDVFDDVRPIVPTERQMKLKD